ncbi:MAG TPA: NYN domain-containing protein [Fervidobacterium sp.]|nr:NYN domain-containing protein [Fervidobacterium sp.]HPZ17050.1 NYN domain-containing protein [Fervidobacterium sp.]HQE48013.1 NYN domain-containing protein [Fervidobacterium sp.]HUM41653.1 NYN domain-containing protein [Fervidobacterium sp.]
MSGSNIFLFFDFQNQPVDVQLVYNEVCKYGRIIGGKAYGSWSKHKMEAFILYNYGIELAEIPEAELLPNKKGNDIRLAVDCVEIALHNNLIDIFFLVTGDADFTALVHKLKSYGKNIMALARTKSTSYELISAVDLFIPYEDIVKNERLIDPIDRLSEEVEVFLKRSGKNFTLENISRFLSSFNINPAKYGVSSLRELSDIIYERKVQKPERIKDIKLLFLRNVIFGDLNEANLGEFSKKNDIVQSDLKMAIDILVRDGVIELNDGYYNVKRSKAFFLTLLEKYPIEYTHISEFIEKSYKAFSANRVKSLNQLLQSEFKLPISEFKSYVEALKRSGCFKGLDDSDYISYSTPAKIVCSLEELKVSTLSYFVKRVLSQTFVFKEEMELLKEVIFSNDERIFEKCIDMLVERGEITELENVYFYTPV